MSLSQSDTYKEDRLIDTLQEHEHGRDTLIDRDQGGREMSDVWATALHESLLMPEGANARERRWSFIQPDNPCPFEEILAPFVEIASRDYRVRSQSAYMLLSWEAHRTLQHSLLQVLASFALETLHSEFTAACKQVNMAGEQDFYPRFLRQMYAGGLWQLFEHYPRLAWLLTRTCDDWVMAHVEFLLRLHSDWQAIEQRFSAGPGQVIEIQPALSDAHPGRRTVMALTFASGDKLVYKPRNVGMEESYYRLLSWCNKQGTLPPFKIVTVLNRGDYGWMEFVQQEPCHDEQMLRRYYQRAGMLCCLLYVLGGVSCGYEHVIAHNEHPVLVDAGPLFHAYPRPERFADQDWEAQSYSVLHTGLLTNWLSTPGMSSVSDRSALAIDEGADPSYAKERQHITLKYGILRSRERLNKVMFNDTAAHIEAFQADIIDGFQQVYQLLLSRRDVLLQEPLQHFRQQYRRLLYRPSWSYGAIFSSFLTAQYLRGDVDEHRVAGQTGQYLIPVEYPLWGKGDWARWQPLSDHELHTLAQGTIPFFTVRVDSIDVAEAGMIPDAFHRSGFDMMRSRLQGLSQAHMAQQVAYIRGVLRSKADGTCAHAVIDDTSVIADERSDRVFVNQALFLADEVLQQAIHLPGGGVIWLHAKFLSRSQQYQYRPMGCSFFEGVSGVALFLAAAARVTGNGRYRAFALAAVQTIRQQLHNHSSLLVAEMGIGGAIGLGSLVYTLTCISRLLDEPPVDAQCVALLIDADLIAADKAFDVIAGSAGALLGLLTLYEASGDQQVLAQAVACGHHLLQSRTRSKAGPLAWPTLADTHTTGFAHGTAGIVYALLRLYSVTHEGSLLDAAQEALRYEDAAFLPAIDNWLEVADDRSYGVTATWCHGAPGIGLARLGGLRVLDTPHIREDIEAALRTTPRIARNPLNFLCCGNMGYVEVLLTAGQLLDRPELLTAARQLALNTMTQVQQQGNFNFNKVLPAWVNIPNFFHGSAGVGYELLRLAYPDTLSSALLWM